jgi:hypothetical protein
VLGCHGKQEWPGIPTHKLSLPQADPLAIRNVLWRRMQGREVPLEAWDYWEIMTADSLIHSK